MRINAEPGSEALLLVDDDEVFTQVMKRAFSRIGFDVHVAFNEKEALELTSKIVFHRAIVDLKLEKTSGLHLIEALKNQQGKLRIVILTGYSSVNTAVEAIKLGAVNYLCKPASVNEILAAFDKTKGDSSVSVADTPPSVDRLEWEHIQKVLQNNGGNISATARDLGMHRRTLQRKLQKRPVKR